MISSENFIILSSGVALTLLTGSLVKYLCTKTSEQVIEQKQSPSDYVLSKDSKYSKFHPHLKPIFLTNNMKKAQEVATLLGIPIDRMEITESNESLSPINLVIKISSEKFRPTMREEIEVMIGEKQYEPGHQFTENELNESMGQNMSINLKVYVSEPGKEIRVFYSTTNGKIVPKTETENPLCFGWDSMFMPNGFQCTISELGKQRNMFNFRSLVYEQIADYLSGRPSVSIYEGHITVTHADDTMPFEEQKAKFISLCETLGVKAILIELQSGAPKNGNFQFQTSQWYNRPFSDVRKLMTETSKQFMSNHWIAERQKIEATPCLRIGSENCPIEDEDVKNFPLTNYFEFHAKISVPCTQDQVETDQMNLMIKELCAKHQAHLSRNAFKKFDKNEHRFLTLRLYGIGQKKAFARFDALLDALKDQMIEVVGTQREYAVWDTNVNHDAGWIDSGDHQ
jgi:hypothetical protein